MNLYTLRKCMDSGDILGAALAISSLEDINASYVTLQNKTPLGYAIRNRLAPIVHLLLDLGANPDISGYSHMSTLHVAANAGDAEIVKLLVDAGANLGSLSKQTWTPLHYAANESITEVLLKAGAKVNARDRKGYTPLHIATSHGTVGMCRVLLEYGANIEEQSDDLWTPLNFATLHDNIPMVEFLIGKGANVHVKNNRDETPLDVANNKGYDRMLTLLSQTQTSSIREYPEMIGEDPS